MKVAAVILAAGAGTRLGGVAKALLPAGATTFLGRIVATTRAAGVDDILVVTGPPFHFAVEAAARDLDVTAICNYQSARGMSSSVAVGFGGLLARSGRIPHAGFLWPVDHPWVTLATLQALLARGEGVPTIDGRGGHPALVPHRLFLALAGCAEMDGGARAVLRGFLPRIPVDDRGVIADVDEPADLEPPCAG